MTTFYVCDLRWANGRTLSRKVRLEEEKEGAVLFDLEKVTRGVFLSEWELKKDRWRTGKSHWLHYCQNLHPLQRTRFLPHHFAWIQVRNVRQFQTQPKCRAGNSCQVKLKTEFHWVPTWWSWGYTKDCPLVTGCLKFSALVIPWLEATLPKAYNMQICGLVTHPAPDSKELRDWAAAQKGHDSLMSARK